MRNAVYLLALMLTVSWLWPSEGAMDGDGLQWVIGWFVVALVVAMGELAANRTGQNVQNPVLRQWGWLPILLFLTGIWLSTWHVFQSGGDRRAALNLAFEWSAIGAAWWLTRQATGRNRGVQSILSLIVALGIGVSVMGIIQHHVTFPRQAEWYQQQRAQLDDGRSLEGTAVARRFEQMGIPLDGPSRELFERRLLSSSEPIGPFALTNTLGGLLAVVIVLLSAGVITRIRDAEHHGAVFWVIAVLSLGTVGYCLLLTKSRTAWVGAVMGLTALFLQQGEQRISVWFKRAAMLGAAVILLAFVGIATGAIDREVILESPKSLQYRLFYWTGAAGVIAESPVFGAGPGNFRQAYLAHKVAESSEEILDPHNLFVDSWCSAGLMGLLGMLLLAFSAIRSLNPARGPHRNLVCLTPPTRTSKRGMFLAVVGASLLHLVWRWFHQGDFWDFESADFFVSGNLILVVPLCACLALWLICPELILVRQVSSPALLCLSVHLMGAGGLHITVSGLLLIVLHSLSGSEKSTSVQPSLVSENRLLRSLKVPVFGLCAIAVVCFGLIPVVKNQHWLAIAAHRKALHDVKGTLVAYDTAISADPLAVESRQRKAETLTYAFIQSVGKYAHSDVDPPDGGIRRRAEFDTAVAACLELIASNKRSLVGYELRSRIRREMAEFSSSPSLAELAVEDMEYVVSNYPTNSFHWAELAQLRFQYGRGDEAREAAIRALSLDHVNHVWGHADRYLQPDLVLKMQRISKSR